MPARAPLPIPCWTIIRADDPRMRVNAVEAGTFASGEWAREISATSNRAWSNAAKVIARVASECPDARYVEGWGCNSGTPEWHAWVDVPLGKAEHSWLRIDATPMWRWFMQHNFYGAVLEVRASEMAEFVAPLVQPRGRALGRLPLAVLEPAVKLGSPQRRPDLEQLRATFGTEAALRSDEVLAQIASRQAERMMMMYADGRSELDRLEAMGVLPAGSPVRDALRRPGSD